MKKLVYVLIFTISALLSYAIFSGKFSNTYTLSLPEHFPEPVIPLENPLNKAKVELGRHLFYDKNLSVNKTKSCASCHQQEKAFTDGLPRALGATGQMHPRGSMSLANIAYAASLNWADPLTETLEHQLLVPLFAEDPIEMGMSGREQEIIDYLSELPIYKKLFNKAFKAQEISIDSVSQALASFQRTLISGNAAYDRYLLGDDTAMSSEALRGMNLFFSEKVECFHCHGGFNFSDSSAHTNEQNLLKPFHNNALYNLDGNGAYPDNNQGLYEITQDVDDMGHFKAPSLRNIKLTAPYMHDGSISSLEEVLEHYSAGGTNILDGENKGDGRTSPLKNKFIKGFELSEQESAELLEFLHSLTDDEFIKNPAHSNPWQESN